MSVISALIASKLATGFLAAGVVVAGSVGVAAAASQTDTVALGADATVSATPTASADAATDATARDTQSFGATDGAAVAVVTADASSNSELCTAFAKADDAVSGTALAELVTAANGAANISALCATPIVSADVSAEVEAKAGTIAHLKANANALLNANTNSRLNTDANVESRNPASTSPSATEEKSADAALGATSNSGLPKLDGNRASGSSLGVTLGAGK